MMADGTIVSTVGKIHVSSLKLANFDSFDMDFHVLDGLPSDVIFGEEFLEQVDAFNTCSEVMDTEDPYMHGLNTLINMGPIQAFFSRKWGSKKASTSKQEIGSAVEEELYWKNKATRSFARVIDEDGKVVQGEVAVGKKSVRSKQREICSGCFGRTVGSAGEQLPRRGKVCDCGESQRQIDNDLKRQPYGESQNVP
jgi:hypothetical protein